MLDTPNVERIVQEHPARLRSLHVLTGGNPRTTVLLHGILAESGDGDVRSDLERLLDQCTPLYKARFEALAQQSQQVLDALAVHWHPLSAGELAGILRPDVNIVSSQLSRLASQGVVAKVPYDPPTRTGFQVAERFFNIWYLMRASRRMRRKLVWLVEFLKLFYEQDDLAQRASKYLEPCDDTEPSRKLRRALLLSMEGQPSGDILGLFQGFVTARRTADLIRLMEEIELSERWQPLHEALKVISSGERNRLRRLAPEIRIPTEQLIDELTGTGTQRSERPAKANKRLHAYRPSRTAELVVRDNPRRPPRTRRKPKA